MHQRTSEVVADMLASLTMPEAELGRQLERAVDPRYWRRLVPSLSIERRPAVRLRARSINDARAGRALTDRGYAQMDRVFAAPLMRRMAGAVERLRASDWPPVFVFLFDEFWALPRSGRLPSLLRAAVGDACQQSPNVWLHYVDAREEAAGWPPHRDHSDGNRVTVWVPLTAARVEDGCMHVLPRHLVPPHLAGSWEQFDTLARNDVLRLLHAARALPADAGSVLCWRANVLHWGGYRVSTAAPRIAFSMEFQSAPDGSNEHGMPTLPLSGALPSFSERLRLVSEMVLLYHSHEPRLARYVELARGLIARADLPDPPDLRTRRTRRT